MKKKQLIKSEKIHSSIKLLELFIEGKITCSDISKDVLDNKMQEEFRSVGWRMFLDILPVAHNIDENWRNITNKNREEFGVLLKRDIYGEESIMKYIRKEITSEQLNLSKNLKDILDLIILDVSRTFQEISLFCSNGIKETLITLLYIWAKNNLDVGYIQGMNEILATMLYALFPCNLTMINYLSDLDSSEDLKEINECSEHLGKKSSVTANISNGFKESPKKTLNAKNGSIISVATNLNTEEKTGVFNIKNNIEEKIQKMKREKSYGSFLKKSSNANLSKNGGLVKINPIPEFKILSSKQETENLKMKQARVQVAKLFFFLNSEEHFDADLYSIFKNVMDRCLKDLFNYSKQDRKSEFDFSDEYKLTITLEQIQITDLSSIKKRIAAIFYYFLRQSNLSLFNHLIDKVDPFIFMFRWILCVLNREIPLKNIIYIWDSIFVVENLDKKASILHKTIPYGSLNFLDFICVSMIDNIKDKLYSYDYDDSTYILQMLMNYPDTVNYKNIIKTALKFRELHHDILTKDYDYIEL